MKSQHLILLLIAILALLTAHGATADFPTGPVKKPGLTNKRYDRHKINATGIHSGGDTYVIDRHGKVGSVKPLDGSNEVKINIDSNTPDKFRKATQAQVPGEEKK